MSEFTGQLTSFGRQFMKEFKDDDLTGLAAELAFKFFLSLFPLVLVLVTFGAYISRWAGVDDPSGQVIDAIGDALPEDASSVLSGQIDDVISETNVGLLSIGLAAALWSASGGASALMKAINRVHDLPETRSFVMKGAIALGLVLFGGIGLLLAVSAMIASQAFAGSIASAVGMRSEFGWIVQLARLPLIVLFVAVAIELVYWIAPNRWTKPRLASPGALFFALAWAIFTVGFAFYVSNFGSYNATYGAIGGVVIMLLWFQISALLILVGAEINAVLETPTSTSAALRIANADAGVVRAVTSEARGREQGQPSLGLAVFAGIVLAVMLWRRRHAA